MEEKGMVVKSIKNKKEPNNVHHCNMAPFISFYLSKSLVGCLSLNNLLYNHEIKH